MSFPAKFPGKCFRCAKPITVGTLIDWDRLARTASHVRCDDPLAPHREAALAIEASRASRPEQAPEEVRALALSVPCPQGLEYLPYQRAGVAGVVSHMRRVGGALLGDDMGLGKTVQAIGVINAHEDIRNVLIVCPASLRLNWRLELERWLTRPMDVGIADTKTLPDTPVVIAGWDSMRKLREKVDARAWDLAIVDEAHYGKNQTSQRTVAVFGRPAKGRGDKKTPADPGIQAKRRLAMTGTPITNRPAELYPILRWCDAPAWPSFFTFARRYCDAKQIEAFKFNPRTKRTERALVWDFSGASNLNELQDKLRSTVLVRRRKTDVLTELPPKRRQVVTIPVDDAGLLRAVRAEVSAWEEREERLDALRAEVELSKASDDPEVYASACAQLQKALQVAFEEISKVRAQTADLKAPYVAEHVADLLETLPKVVVMAHHHAVVDVLMSRLADYGAVSLTGETPMATRQANVQRFQTDPTCRVFVGSIQAAGVGLTLTAASTIVFAELDWVPGNVTQAEDRIHRIGQTDSVLVQHVVLDGSLDTRMVQVLLSKQAIADAALDDVRAAAAAEPVSPSRSRTATEDAQPAALEVQGAAFSAAQVEAIHEGLRVLAGLDTDGARLRNDMGYSKIDVRIGHSLAKAPWLSKKQAALGFRLVRKYRRQLDHALLSQAGVAVL